MIYLDNAATTAMYPECLDDFRKYGVDDFFNPSAYYAPAGVNAHVVAAARKTILSVLGAPDGANLLFTASGSESDNIAARVRQARDLPARKQSRQTRETSGTAA